MNDSGDQFQQKVKEDPACTKSPFHPAAGACRRSRVIHSYTVGKEARLSPRLHLLVGKLYAKIGIIEDSKQF